MFSHVYFIKFFVFLQHFVKHLILMTETLQLINLPRTFCTVSDSVEAPVKEIAAHLV